jgi:hypothetical protein
MGDSPAMAKYLALLLKIHVRELPDMAIVMVTARVDVKEVPLPPLFESNVATNPDRFGK